VLQSTALGTNDARRLLALYRAYFACRAGGSPHISRLCASRPIQSSVPLFKFRREPGGTSSALTSTAKRTLFGALACALLPSTAATSAQLPFEPASSAAYLRDLCSGRRPGMSQSDQIRRCSIYLSSFQDASDEYREAGTKLFCPPETMSTETVRRVFLEYVIEPDGAAEFLPAGRALVQALRQVYPCTFSQTPGR
jgi:Ssp1 endopeptidase immunity protein Rap1a